ncbi:MAG: alpha-L-fucosidase [Parabacteroides sp.]|nr:alpha-L-fucosidase [Parabacteroides sp.]
MKHLFDPMLLLRRGGVLSVFLVFSVTLLFAQDIPLPSVAQLEWQQKERIMFVHFGPAAFQAREYDDWSSDINEMYLSKLDTDQWCQVAKSWGAKMIVFVAKHCGGFCWWQTKTSDYGVAQIPWKSGKGDVMKELSASCKKYGLDMGVYVYPGDEHWGAGIGSGGITKDPSKQEAYNKVYRQQLTELLSRYGTIKEVWFDGNCHIPVKDILKEHAPDAVYFQGKSATLRWVGNEDGYAPDPNWYTLSKEDGASGTATSLHSDVNGEAYLPVEIDVPLLKNGGHKWFWAPGTDSLIMTKQQLMDIYYKSVGRGSVLLLNSTPDTTGLIPASHVTVYKAFGKEIERRFAKPLKSMAANGRDLQISFRQPTFVNHLVLQEDLKMGQRVLSYIAEGSLDGKTWTTLIEGTSVGQKKIDRFPSHRVKHVRIRILKSKALPHILNFALYQVKDNDEDVQQQKKEAVSRVGYWEGNTYDEIHWKELELDLTPYMNKIGQYDVDFCIQSYDYSNQEPSGLEFKDVELQMYGKQMPEAIELLKNRMTFRINRSQQTLDDFPTKLKMNIRRRDCKSSGEIQIKRVTY